MTQTTHLQHPHDLHRRACLASTHHQLILLMLRNLIFQLNKKLLHRESIHLHLKPTNKPLQPTTAHAKPFKLLKKTNWLSHNVSLGLKGIKYLKKPLNLPSTFIPCLFHLSLIILEIISLYPLLNPSLRPTSPAIPANLCQMGLFKLIATCNKLQQMHLSKPSLITCIFHYQSAYLIIYCP